MSEENTANAADVADNFARPSDGQIKGFRKLRAQFPDEAISQLPKGNTTLSYVGHAAVTDRLLSVDPLWNWEPCAEDERGAPITVNTKDGQPIGLWIRLTLLGVTRLGYGSCEARKGDNAIKELIGDAIRNAAMRFGVALELWSKNDLESTVVPQEPEMNIPGLLKGLVAIGVDRSRVEKKLGHAADQMEPWEYDMLRNLGQKLKANAIKLDDAFPAVSLNMADVGVGTTAVAPKSEVNNSPQPKKKAA